jgi:hypothetical protein
MADDAGDKKPKGRPSPARKQQDAKRAKSVEEFERQVAEGSVKIRQMTPAERKANPPKDRPPKRRAN